MNLIQLTAALVSTFADKCPKLAEKEGRKMNMLISVATLAYAVL